MSSIISPVKGKVVYNNGIHNRYFEQGEYIPDGYVKGGMNKPNTNRERVFDWNTPENKEYIIELLKNKEGIITECADDIGVSSTNFRKNLKKYMPDISPIDFLKPSSKLSRNPTYANELFQEYNMNVEDMIIGTGIRRDVVIRSLKKHGLI